MSVDAVTSARMRADALQIFRSPDARPVHFVGIAGAGMSALAELFVRRGVTVTGSDMSAAGNADLEVLGVKVHRGHHASFVAGARAVVASSAIPSDHVELKSASDLRIPIIRRAEVRYANDAFCRATGYSRGEVDTLSTLELLPPDSAELVAETSRTLEARQPVRVTTTMVRKNGTTFSAVCIFAPIVDSRRGVTHVVCVVRDLTDEVHLREEMVRAERLAAIGDLVSSVAHELNNPLQSIVGTLDMLTAVRRDPEIEADLERADWTSPALPRRLIGPTEMAQNGRADQRSVGRAPRGPSS